MKYIKTSNTSHLSDEDTTNVMGNIIAGFVLSAPFMFIVVLVLSGFAA